MERTIHWGGEAIVYSVKRSRRRRTVALRVEPSGAITVYAPMFVWGPLIDRFVRKQRDWIFKKLAYFKERPVPPPVTLELRAQLIQETEARLPTVIARYAERLGVIPKSVKVANQKRRWGSCSARGALRFSWRMARLPDEIFDYIVIHELAHLREMNHSPRFWAVVQSICSSHKSHRRWLRKNISLLIILVAGFVTAGWCAAIPTISSTTVVQSTTTVAPSTSTVIQSTTAVVQSTAAVQFGPMRPPINYVCPYDSPICPFVGCYGSHNYVGCIPTAIVSKTKQVKVTNLNNGGEVVVGRQQIWQLFPLSKMPARNTEVLVDCATSGANCPAADQHHYLSCAIIQPDMTGHLALLACGNIIDLYMPLSVLYTTKPVADIQSAIPPK